MALEQSVFEDGMIKKFLLTNWDINCLSYKKIGLGTANCYLINCGQTSYFLKEYQTDILESQIVNEVEILERLQEKKIPSAYIIRTIRNENFVKYKGHYVILENYICGDTYGYYDFPEAMLSQMAVMLAKVHLALEDINLPYSLDEEWVKGDAIPKYMKLLEFIENHKEDFYYEQIKGDLVYKKSLLIERQKDLKKYFTGLTYRNSHGDYQGCQIIGENDRIKAIIDFTAASRLPVVWEIMRSFIQTSFASRNNSQIDIQALCRYVKKYCEYAPLNKTDIKAMPYVYVYQLLRSTYGYKEYLLTNSEDREELISFAFWRTRMCRQIYENADEIVNELISAIEIS